MVQYIIVYAGNCMSYSMTVPFANQTERDAMLAFFNRSEFVDEFLQLQQKLSPLASRASLTGGEHLGYLPNVNPARLAGFQATELTRLNWAVCVWAAVKAGRPDNKGSFIYYDSEKMRIDQSCTHPTNVWANADGVMQFGRQSGVLERLFTSLSNKRIADFIEKINTAWEHEKTNTLSIPTP